MQNTKQEWRYYNHAIIPNCPPNKTPDLTPFKGGSIWKTKWEGTPYLLRYISDYDCSNFTNWWYIIKDKPFDINELKAKRRYEVNKGKNHFDVRIIDPCKYREELYLIQVAAFSAYPEKYRPKIEKTVFCNNIDSWHEYIVFGAFYKASNELCGYALLKQFNDSYIDFTVLKTNPAFECYAINAALIEKILDYFARFLNCGGIICDGARSINHETKFQDYLEKYFGFRKAYCVLHIKYNPKIAWLIKLLFPFRKLLMKFDIFGNIHLVNSVLKMEEIVRGKG